MRANTDGTQVSEGQSYIVMPMLRPTRLTARPPRDATGLPSLWLSLCVCVCVFVCVCVCVCVCVAVCGSVTEGRPEASRGGRVVSRLSCDIGVTM
jgi:hypothetical protein